MYLAIRTIDIERKIFTCEFCILSFQLDNIIIETRNLRFNEHKVISLLYPLVVYIMSPRCLSQFLAYILQSYRALSFQMISYSLFLTT